MSAEQSGDRLDPAHGALALRCQLQYADVAAFVRSYAVNLSPGGMFIATREPPAVGTVLRFEVVLADERPVLRGEGLVVWTAGGDPAPDPAAPAPASLATPASPADPATASADAGPLSGLGVRFGRLDAPSRAVIAQVLAHKAAHPDLFFTRVPDPYAAPVARPDYRPSAVSLPESAHSAAPPLGPPPASIALLPESARSAAPALPPTSPPVASALDHLLPPHQGLPPTSQWTPTGLATPPVAADEEAALQALLQPVTTTPLPTATDAARLLEELLDRRPS